MAEQLNAVVGSAFRAAYALKLQVVNLPPQRAKLNIIHNKGRGGGKDKENKQEKEGQRKEDGEKGKGKGRSTLKKEGKDKKGNGKK